MLTKHTTTALQKKRWCYTCDEPVAAMRQPLADLNTQRRPAYGKWQIREKIILESELNVRAKKMLWVDADSLVVDMANALSIREG